MSYLIICLVVLAFAHFIYESMIAPSVRMSIRFELFALRDRLRTLKIEHAEGLDDKHYHYLQDSINSIILALPKIEVVTVVQTQAAIERDPKLKERLAARQAILDDCAISELTDIRKRSVELTIAALGTNAGMWSVYVLPLMGLGAAYKSVERRVKEIISLSEPDLQKVAPSLLQNGAFTH